VTVANTPSRSWRGARGTALLACRQAMVAGGRAHVEQLSNKGRTSSSGGDSTNDRSVAVSGNLLARSRASAVRREQPSCLCRHGAYPNGKRCLRVELRAVRPRCALAKKRARIRYKIMQMHEKRTCLNLQQSFSRMLRHRPTIPRGKNA